MHIYIAQLDWDRARNMLTKLESPSGLWQSWQPVEQSGEPTGLWQSP